MSTQSGEIAKSVGLCGGSCCPENQGADDGRQCSRTFAGLWLCSWFTLFREHRAEGLAVYLAQAAGLGIGGAT